MLLGCQQEKDPSRLEMTCTNQCFIVICYHLSLGEWDKQF